MAQKMTFSLDEETAARLRQASETLLKPKSEIVREAIHAYLERIGRLSDIERKRLLKAFDRLVPDIPNRPLTEVETELRSNRQGRRRGGRRTDHGQ